MDHNEKYFALFDVAFGDWERARREMINRLILNCDGALNPHELHDLFHSAFSSGVRFGEKVATAEV